MPDRNESFPSWMAKVDAHLVSYCGLDHMCLPDAQYWDAWNDGTDPKDMAIEVLAEEGFVFDSDQGDY
jgi:hypothetical protein